MAASNKKSADELTPTQWSIRVESFIRFPEQADIEDVRRLVSDWIHFRRHLQDAKATIEVGLK